MFVRDKLYSILDELNAHKHSRAELLTHQIEQRLNDALHSYLHSIDVSYDYLSTKDELNVLKKLNRGN